MHRHRRELTHPRDRHQAPERLIFPHDPTDLPVRLIDVRIQIVDPLDEEAYGGRRQRREGFLALRERLLQSPAVVGPKRSDESELREVDPEAIVYVRWYTRSSRARNTTERACSSSVFTATNRIVGR